jgi:voltage-gated potassium channel
VVLLRVRDDDRMTESETTAKGRTSTDGNMGYEIFMAGLSILSIVNLALALLVKDEALSYVIILINLLLTLIFMLDFIWRLFRAESKRHYLLHGYGWADFLSSLPFAQTNVLRLFRLIRVYRLLKDYGARAVGRALIKDRAETALLMLLLVGILVLEFGSLQMLRLEQFADGANITTASDALWFVIVTMATVGYGDQFPTTNPGRLLGTMIIVVGVGIFGTLTGYLANLFLSPRERRKEDQPTDIELRLQELKDLSARQAQAIGELEELVQRKDR